MYPKPPTYPGIHADAIPEQTIAKELTPLLWKSQKAVVARSNPMENEKALRKTVVTKIEFRLNSVE